MAVQPQWFRIVTTNDPVDIYVEPVEHISPIRKTWFIRIGTRSLIVGVHDNLLEAVTHAIQMARYRAQGGQNAQVHVREKFDLPWHTIWCGTGLAPRTPEGAGRFVEQNIETVFGIAH
jgi:hypothetical protein